MLKSYANVTKILNELSEDSQPFRELASFRGIDARTPSFAFHSK